MPTPRNARATAVPAPAAPAPVASSPSTAVAVPAVDSGDIAAAMSDDEVGALLREQMDQVDTVQRLPQVKIMPAGVGMYEFSDTGDVVREFEAIILHGHPRNVLWDKAFDAPRAEGETPAPACQSPDGVTGFVREGFAHPDLGAPAANGAVVGCRACALNQWNSATMIAGKQGKGKACTNQRSVYVWMPDREAPVELVLPPTSITPFDEYLTQLLNRRIPMQTMLTRFTQERMQRPGTTMQWAVARFAVSRALDQNEIRAALRKRTEFLRQMTPVATVTVEAVPSVGADGAPVGQSDDLPF